MQLEQGRKTHTHVAFSLKHQIGGFWFLFIFFGKPQNAEYRTKNSDYLLQNRKN